MIRIQPDESITLRFGLKMPGAGFTVKQVGMEFRYDSLSKTHLPDAYERLLLDAMLGDSTLYARSDALEASWRFIDPILHHWKGRFEESLLLRTGTERAIGKNDVRRRLSRRLLRFLRLNNVGAVRESPPQMRNI